MINVAHIIILFNNKVSKLSPSLHAPLNLLAADLYKDLPPHKIGFMATSEEMVFR